MPLCLHTLSDFNAEAGNRNFLFEAGRALDGPAVAKNLLRLDPVRHNALPATRCVPPPTRVRAGHPPALATHERSEVGQGLSCDRRAWHVRYSPTKLPMLLRRRDCLGR